MVIKTLKDAEVEIRNLINRVSTLSKSSGATVDTSQFATKTELAALANRPTPKTDDVELTPDGNTAIHKLINKFLTNVFFDAQVFMPSLGITDNGTSNWAFSAVPTDKLYLYGQSGTALIIQDLTAGNFLYTFSGNIDFDAAGTRNIGATNRPLSIYSQSFDASISVHLGYTTATRPLKVDASKNVISALITLSSANDVTGVLPIANGGTGQSSFSDGALQISGGAMVSISGMFTGTIYVAASSGGATTTAKTVVNGWITA